MVHRGSGEREQLEGSLMISEASETVVQGTEQCVLCMGEGCWYYSNWFGTRDNKIETEVQVQKSSHFRQTRQRPKE